MTSPAAVQDRLEEAADPTYEAQVGRAGIGSRQWLVPGALLAAATAWTLWRTGIGVTSATPWFEHVALTWPNSDVPDMYGYRLRSPVGLLLYRALPFRGSTAFGVLHAWAILVAYLGLAGWYLRRLGSHRGLLAMAVVVLAPITAVLIEWIGIYDAFTMWGWVALLWSLRAPWTVQAAVGVFLGFQNAEQGAVGLLVLWLLRPLVAPSETSFRPAVALAGCGVGKLLLELYLRSHGAVSGSRLTWVTDWTLLHPLLSSGARMLPVFVWSGLCGVWFFIPQLPRPSWDRQLVIRVAAAMALWILIAAIAADHTRLLAITSVPVVALAVREVADRRQWSIKILLRSPAWWVLVLAPPTIVYMTQLLPLGWRGLPWAIPHF